MHVCCLVQGFEGFALGACLLKVSSLAPWRLPCLLETCVFDRPSFRLFLHVWVGVVLRLCACFQSLVWRENTSSQPGGPALLAVGSKRTHLYALLQLQGVRYLEALSDALQVQ